MWITLLTLKKIARKVVKKVDVKHIFNLTRGFVYIENAVIRKFAMIFFRF